MSPTPWLGPDRAGWVAEVEAWVRDATAATGTGALVSLEPVKERPWGAVLRATTDQATLYFKAPGPIGRHELRLVTDLEPWPELRPDLVASDPDRCWMLLHDHGQPVRDVRDAAGQVAAIEALLPTYAAMQAATMPETSDWLEAGVPDRRIEGLAIAARLLVEGGTPVGPLSIEAGERDALLAGLPVLAAVCAELAGTGTETGLDHADLHGTNVLVAGATSRLVDWGDACITHPFATLMVTFEHVVAALTVADRRPVVLRLRDAYLEPWGPAGDRGAFGRAVWLAHVSRALNVAYEAPDTPGAQDEILALLRAWRAKRPLLDRPDDVIQPVPST